MVVYTGQLFSRLCVHVHTCMYQTKALKNTNSVPKIHLETIPSTQESHEEKSLAHFKYSVDCLPEQCFTASVQTLDPLVNSKKDRKKAPSAIFQVTFNFQCKWYQLTVCVTIHLLHQKQRYVM